MERKKKDESKRNRLDFAKFESLKWKEEREAERGQLKRKEKKIKEEKLKKIVIREKETQELTFKMEKQK